MLHLIDIDAAIIVQQLFSNSEFEIGSYLAVFPLPELLQPISNQQSAISNQQSAISNQQSAISNQQSA
ncbi:MAG: hypothetical protein R3F50_08350 [Gammaproteobacteria bacterium]